MIPMPSIHQGIPTLQPAKSWSLRTRQLDFGKRPCIMGILNVTPDSFSDGGSFFTVESAVDRAKQMEDAGADILDIGGESTRPYSQSVDTDEELARIIPVLQRLDGKISIPISIDTTKAEVARAAIELGAEIIKADSDVVTGDCHLANGAINEQTGRVSLHPIQLVARAYGIPEEQPLK